MPRIPHLVPVPPWVRLKQVKLARVKPVGMLTVLATLICYKYKTVLALTLSEYSLTERMFGKRSWDTTRGLTATLPHGKPQEWFPLRSFNKHNKHNKHDKHNSKIFIRFIPLPYLNPLAFNSGLAYRWLLHGTLCFDCLRELRHGVLVCSHRSRCLYKAWPKRVNTLNTITQKTHERTKNTNHNPSLFGQLIHLPHRPNGLGRHGRAGHLPRTGRVIDP